MSKYSVVIPVFNNEKSIPRLFQGFSKALKSRSDTELLFVLDGCTDRSEIEIASSARNCIFEVRIIKLSRNFGSFSAIRTGLKMSTGDFVGVISADLQEPVNLISEFFEALESNTCDIAYGSRSKRNDSLLTRLTSNIFWFFYRKFINREIPKGGIDVFACNRQVIDSINKLEENSTSLIGLLFWLGYRRHLIPYERQSRLDGKSEWTIKKKLEYMSNSVFSFSNLPIRILKIVAILGMLSTILLSFYFWAIWMFGEIQLPGYLSMILIILFSNFLIMFSVAILGSYVWRIHINSQNRPYSIVVSEIKTQVRGKSSDFYSS